VTLVEGNQLYHLQSTYDQNGMLVRSEYVVSQAPAVIITRLERAGVR
jgi:hypothetical protein